MTSWSIGVCSAAVLLPVPLQQVVVVAGLMDKLERFIRFQRYLTGLNTNLAESS